MALNISKSSQMVASGQAHSPAAQQQAADPKQSLDSFKNKAIREYQDDHKPVDKDESIESCNDNEKMTLEFRGPSTSLSVVNGHKQSVPAPKGHLDVTVKNIEGKEEMMIADQSAKSLEHHQQSGGPTATQLSNQEVPWARSSATNGVAMSTQHAKPSKAKTGKKVAMTLGQPGGQGQILIKFSGINVRANQNPMLGVIGQNKKISNKAHVGCGPSEPRHSPERSLLARDSVLAAQESPPSALPVLDASLELRRSRQTLYRTDTSRRQAVLKKTATPHGPEVANANVAEAGKKAGQEDPESRQAEPVQRDADDKKTPAKDLDRSWRRKSKLSGNLSSEQDYHELTARPKLAVTEWKEGPGANQPEAKKMMTQASRMPSQAEPGQPSHTVPSVGSGENLRDSRWPRGAEAGSNISSQSKLQLIIESAKEAQKGLTLQNQGSLRDMAMPVRPIRRSRYTDQGDHENPMSEQPTPAEDRDPAAAKGEADRANSEVFTAAEYQIVSQRTQFGRGALAGKEKMRQDSSSLTERWKSAVVLQDGEEPSQSKKSQEKGTKYSASNMFEEPRLAFQSHSSIRSKKMLEGRETKSIGNSTHYKNQKLANSQQNVLGPFAPPPMPGEVRI